MAENLGGYVTRIRQVLHEPDEDSSMWSNTFLRQLFNDHYRRRCAQLIMAFEGYFVEIATRDLTANQARYAWPAGFERLHKLELVRSDGSTDPVSRHERHQSVNPPSYGAQDTYNPTYRPIGSGFVLEPAPLATVTNGIRMEYTALPAELTADSDTIHPDFPKIFVSLVVYDTAVAALHSENLLENGRAQTVVQMRNEFDMDWERFIDSRTISSNRVRPFLGHYLDA